MKFLVTGGAGFIGSALIRFIIQHTQDQVLNLDKLTYAGNLSNLEMIDQDPRYQFIQGDICDSEVVRKILTSFQPDIVIHLAAESHVDRSITGPAEFIQTNIIGTYTLLECCRDYWESLPANRKQAFKFHHVSTDEVFGDLGASKETFSETTAYAPSSPYSASKASSDHLVRSWQRTYGLPTVISNCSNNYGPYQFPEKLIPLMILNAMALQPLPVYGDGRHVRDWLYVDDHARALYLIATQGKLGETYTIGGNSEISNLELVTEICNVLDKRLPIAPKNSIRHYREIIRFVEDRPGHDERYAVNSQKIQQQLNWKPQETLSSGISKTIDWYLANPDWCFSASRNNTELQMADANKKGAKLS